MPPSNEVEDDKPLTPAHAADLAAMRSSVQTVLAALHSGDAYWATDHALRRFLVARKWNVPAAAAQFTAAMVWRREPAPEVAPGVPACELLARMPEPLALRRYFAWGFAGLDRDGFPVLIERVGHCDLLGVHDAVSTPAFLAWVAWCVLRRPGAHAMPGIDSCISSFFFLGSPLNSPARSSPFFPGTTSCRSVPWRGRARRSASRAPS